MASLFEIPIEKLKGIGAKRAELFRKLGVGSVGELIRYYPRDYEDWSLPTPIAEVTDASPCCIKAVVGSTFNEGYTKNSGKFISKVTVYDESGAMGLLFFNNRYISSMLKYGEEYYFYGKAVRDLKGLQMTAPTFSTVQEGQGVHPVYGLTAGLPNRIVAGAVKSALELLPEEIKDPIPETIRNTYGLCSLEFALRNIHFPKTMEEMKTAKKRLVFEELLILNLGLRQLKNIQREETSITASVDFTEEFKTLLPFQLTNAQNRVIKECIADMKRNTSPMNRLVQGDVGSGKTAVAAALCYHMVKNGHQAAFMVPTEILAQQHYQSVSKLMEHTGIRIELLVGSLTAAKKKALREQLAQGEIDLIIGTHALITDDTQFRSLGLAITDEQHRFGVAQRAKLLSKGENPHLLVMSATPIPRTLGLIIFGDLDISIIDELPPGRQEIETLLIDSHKRVRAYNFLKKHISMGEQCYIVCPLVEEGEGEMDLASAENYAAELMLNQFADLPVGLMHGKMRSAEKDRVMDQFTKGEISLLVATTVIEVGVDVPNATIMMIENAERFGLSQLHQLRGRVGRGSKKSYCILLSDARKEETVARLQTMCRTNNGFEIADEDLKLRGPGDFFGQRQHGLPQLTIAELTDMYSLEASQKAAEEILTLSPDLSHSSLKGLRSEIKRLFRRTGGNTYN